MIVKKPKEFLGNELVEEQPNSHIIRLSEYLPAFMRERISEVYRTNPDIFLFDESILKKHFATNKQPIHSAVKRVRYRIWNFIEAPKNKQPLHTGLLDYVCTTRDMKILMEDPYICAYLVCPPAQYEEFMTDVFREGLSVMKEVLDLPHMEGEKINTSLLKLKLDILGRLDDRLHGKATQKIESKTHTTQVNIDATKMETLEEIDSKLAQLERLVEQAQPPVLEVEHQVLDEK